MRFKTFMAHIDAKSIALQLMLFVAIFLIGYYLIHNALHNLSSLGATPGFTFLTEPAGYDIPFSFYPLPKTPTHFQIFLGGLSNTLMVSVLGIILATVLGFIIGITQLSSNWLLAKLARGYVELFRNIPVLLQIIFWYTGVLSAFPHPRNSYHLFNVIFLNLRGLYFPKPIYHATALYFFLSIVIAILMVITLFFLAKNRQKRTGNKLKYVAWSPLLIIILPLFTVLIFPNPISWMLPVFKGFNFVGGYTLYPEFVALWFALSIYTAAFIGEAVRAALQSVAKGQREAALSLGLTRGLMLKLVIIPQAMKVLIPPLISNYLNLLKNSSLGMMIGFPDIVATLGGTTLMQTGQAIEALAIVMATYAFFSLSISLFLNWYNHRLLLRS